MAAAEQETVFLVLIDRLTVSDLMLPEAEALRRLVTYGGVGLANVRTAGGGSASGYLTLGSGGRAVAGEHAGLGFGVSERWRGEEAGLLFAALTGEEAGSELVHLGIYEQHVLATDNKRPTVPGMLGSALREAGVSTVVYGNSDAEGKPQRYGVLVAMDSGGRVEEGDVSERTLIHDAAWPYGLRTDYGYLLNQAQRHLGTRAFVVIDLGDLARLEASEALLPPHQMARLRRETVGRIAGFVETLWEQSAAARTRGILLLAVPSPSVGELRQGFLLTPLLMADFGPESSAVPEGGLLSSATTRRAGLVANVDIAATVLGLFGLERTGSGRPLEFAPAPAPWRTVETLYERITLIHSQRLPLIQPYFFVQLATVLVSAGLAVGASLFGWRISQVRPWLLGLHLAVVAFPLALLLLPLLPLARTLDSAWLMAAGVTVLLAAGVFWSRRWGEAVPFTLLAGLTVTTMVADLLTGTQLLSSSHLGYDPIGGSRYYGIGNEYMGLLLGSVAVAAGGVFETAPARWRRPLLWAVGLCFTGIVFLLASPTRGANVGGTISAVLGLGVVLILLAQDRLYLRHVVLLTALVVGVVGAAAAYDLLRLGPDTSHLGGAVQMVSAEGGDPLWRLFERKLEMNVRLIRLTVWSRAFFVSLLAALLFAFLRPQSVRRLLHAYPYMARALRGSLAGALVALAVNDSGIVAAATLMIPVVSTLLYLVLTLAYRAERGGEPEAGFTSRSANG